MNKVLALDIATNTGWAFLDGDKIFSGEWDLSIKKGQHPGRKLGVLWFKLRAVHNQWGIKSIVYERPGHLQGSARKVLPAIQGAIEMWGYVEKIPCKSYSPKEIKKYATGNGNANKEQMLEAARNKWPDLSIHGHDQADALWLLDFARNNESEL